MSATTHDNLCDWQPCPMCLETAETNIASTHVALDGNRYNCCPDCDNDDRERPAIPTFDDCWNHAPSMTKRITMREDAEWFWLKGQQAGRVAEQVETRRWLQQMVEGYSERVNKC